MNFEKLLGEQVFQKPHLNSLSIFLKFVRPSLFPFAIAVSFIPSSNFWSGYFNVLLNLVIVPTV